MQGYYYYIGLKHAVLKGAGYSQVCCRHMCMREHTRSTGQGCPWPVLAKVGTQERQQHANRARAQVYDARMKFGSQHRLEYIGSEGICEPLTWTCALCLLWGLCYENRNPSGWHHTSTQLHSACQWHPASCQPGTEQK